MNEKNDILEAWIMVERLSEGDLPNDRSLLPLDGPRSQDFYSRFQREISRFRQEMKKKGRGGSFQRNGGIVVYFDAFDFQEVEDFLREEYGLEPSKENHSSNESKKKFGFMLSFDSGLTFKKDRAFFTVSSYIRKFQSIPREKDFHAYEEDQNEWLIKAFDEAETSPEKFNKAMQDVFDRYHVDVTKCRMKVMNNLDSEGLVHSFFIPDLKNAQGIKTANLSAYLDGGAKELRVNLDSRRASAKPTFWEILQPQNYPLGRFPSETKYALSLMQQVAVNLSVGADPRPVRSVNGPPGTGKTTLLKDIFAQLVVQQAYDIANLPAHRLLNGTPYCEQATIKLIPPKITENSIVVASSNNSAVQNIVNELPLCQGIDQRLLESLKQADYFRVIANAKLSANWKKENGKNTEELTLEPDQSEKELWGVFSLEGGKSDNMTNILVHIKHIHKYLEENFQPDRRAYEDFLEQYEKVRALRAQAQAAASRIGAPRDYVQELNEARISYQRVLAQKINRGNEELARLSRIKKESRQLLSQLKSDLEKVKSRKTTAQRNIDNMKQCLDALQKPRSGFFENFMNKRAKEDYNRQLAEIAAQIIKYQNEEADCVRAEDELNRKMAPYSANQGKCDSLARRLQTEFAGWKKKELDKISALEKKAEQCKKNTASSVFKPLNMDQEYDELQLSNPWFDESYRVAQSKLFIAALRVRKQFLYENRKNLQVAARIWSQQDSRYLDKKPAIEAAWNWINMAIPVISTTFASFSRMCRNLEAESLGHLFIDEAGQALPQAAVGAVYRSRHVMAVGDPAQIKPVQTLDPSTFGILSREFRVTEKYLSDSASVQTLMDAASRYGFDRKPGQSEDSWIGIPLWVHRRCQDPMFTISNTISYDGLMVQGMTGTTCGKTGWFDIGGMANKNYVKEQGDFLAWKIKELIDQNPKIIDPGEKDEIFVISPFSEVAFQLARKLDGIGFTRRDEQYKPTNVGTVHTFQGKEAPIVFLVLGGSGGAARWAMSEPNMMNVAATRAKREFYMIGDRKLYLSLGCDVVDQTDEVIREYKREHPELVQDTIPEQYKEPPADTTAAKAAEKAVILPQTANPQSDPAPISASRARPVPASPAEAQRMTGTIVHVGKGSSSFYAYVSGEDGKRYTITESIYSQTDQAKEVIQKGNRISFIPKAGQRNPFATSVRPDVRKGP